MYKENGLGGINCLVRETQWTIQTQVKKNRNLTLLRLSRKLEVKVKRELE